MDPENILIPFTMIALHFRDSPPHLITAAQEIRCRSEILRRIILSAAAVKHRPQCILLISATSIGSGVIQLTHHIININTGEVNQICEKKQIIV